MMINVARLRLLPGNTLGDASSDSGKSTRGTDRSGEIRNVAGGKWHDTCECEKHTNRRELGGEHARGRGAEPVARRDRDAGR